MRTCGRSVQRPRARRSDRFSATKVGRCRVRELASPSAQSLNANDELAALETIKVDLVIPAPIAGKIVAVNDALTAHPELVNSDPYGEGWLAEIAPSNWADFDALLDAEAYLPQMQARAELEREK